MAYLENKKILHRDLAARNLLVKPTEKSYKVKVSDFGLARHTEGAYKSSKSNVPIRWTAPEIFEGKPATTKSDVWSFGNQLAIHTCNSQKLRVLIRCCSLGDF